jgi:hypothetical protein
LLHGSDDTIIPPTELLWISRDIPKEYLVSAIISPAISHVEVGSKAGLGQAGACTLDGDVDSRGAKHCRRHEAEIAGWFLDRSVERWSGRAGLQASVTAYFFPEPA